MTFVMCSSSCFACQCRDWSQRPAWHVTREAQAALQAVTSESRLELKVKKVTYVTSQSLEIPTLYMHHTGEWWQWKGILQNFVIKETNYQSWSKGNSYPFQNGPSTWSKAMTEKMILEKFSGRILWTWTFHCSYLH